MLYYNIVRVAIKWWKGINTMNEKSLVGVPEKNGDVSEALNSTLSEDVNEVKNAQERWKKTRSSIFSSLSRVVSRFFVSRVKSDEAVRVQATIQRCFMRTDYMEKIQTDINLQNVFLLGYCRALEETMEAYESAISFDENNTMKSVVSTYKHMKPILLCLDKNFQLGHKELAQQIGVSESSLSNFMNKVQEFRIFNSTRIGKNRYYTLAYPNGEKALKFVKEYDKSLPEGYTDCLLKLLGILQDAVLYKNMDEKHIMKECEDMFFQYTTKPALCRQKLNSLFSSLHSERLFSSSLVMIECAVKKSVTIFTKNIKSEKDFISPIINNLSRNIEYRWFVEKSDEFDTEEKLGEYLAEQLFPEGGQEVYRNVFYCVKPEKEIGCLLGEDSDVVIYDQEIGYSSIEISEETPYIKMQDSEIDKYEQYIEENEVYLCRMEGV